MEMTNFIEDPLSVANYLIQKAQNEGIELTPMKLLKLVYIAHGWHLGLKDSPLIRETVQAWKYGPVIQSVYNAFRSYSSNNITSFHYDQFLENYTLHNQDNCAFLDKIWDVYKNYDGLQLSTLTHQQGTPWDQVWNHKNGKHQVGAYIPDDLIKAYYQKKANASLEHAN